MEVESVITRSIAVYIFVSSSNHAAKQFHPSSYDTTPETLLPNNNGIDCNARRCLAKALSNLLERESLCSTLISACVWAANDWPPGRLAM